jgi:HK97 family phage prohead protease
MPKNEFDFGGYATKNGITCTDGRTILKDAFKHQDGTTVPLVWQHLHNDPTNVLGHAVLENRADGVYCHGKFNDTEAGQQAAALVEHGDITSLSIYANQLKEQKKQVIHGAIREVSLVLAGANPGATIDNLSFSHGDGTYEDDPAEALICFNQLLVHGDVSEEDEGDNGDGLEHSAAEVFETFTEEQKAVVYAMLAHASGEDKEDKVTGGVIKHAAKAEATVQDVFNTLNDEQKNVVYYMISKAMEGADSGSEASHSDIKEKGESIMKNNVFDKATQEPEKNVLSHEQKMEILGDAKKYGSLKDSFLAHTETYGFNPIDVLFPDAKDVNGGAPAVIQRDTAWVSKVLGKTKHTPFSRIRTRVADITADEARAKGYVTGNLKKEEIIPLLKRSTTPTTIYKKQKLDRDDIQDITDFDVVVWLKQEMRGMLDEELARAILISDGRSAADEDKINEQNIRPIITDDANLFIHRIELEHATATDDIIDEFIRARKYYKGTGTPDLYISTDLLTEMLLLKDQFGHRLYKTVQELASVLRVNEIIEVEPMNTATRKVSDTQSNAILGIVVNLQDYTIGADKGGQVGMFDDFDIDYNQYKYLIETRCSGALTMPKSALIIERKPATI